MDLHDRIPFDAIDSLRSYIPQIRQRELIVERPDESEFHELARSPRAHADSSRESSIFDSGVLVLFGHVHFRTTRPIRASKGIRRRTLRLKESGFSIAAFNRRVNWGSADVHSACGSHAIK
jgi:hypothetical protein